MANYDVIVIGCGGVGSATLWQLARRGARVLGIEQFDGVHDRGSSHGHTRVIRQAYFEHPDYVPLLVAAYDLWRELEHDWEKKLYYDIGLLEAGPPDGVVVPGVLASARKHDLAVEQLDAVEVERRFPGFRLQEGTSAVFERDAGYLLVEDCVQAHLDRAVALGAELKTRTAVREWRVENGVVRVDCDDESFTASRLVLATGAWSGPLLGRLGIRLRVVAKHLHWYANDDPRYLGSRGCPVFFFETTNGYFYGFPQLDARGVKVAEHSGDGEDVTDPLHVCRDVDPVDRQRTVDFLKNSMPGVSERPTEHSVCMYTMSPDEHFIVDADPDHENVLLAAGLSGHGFKFTPVLGQALAELALDGHTSLPVGFLSLDRLLDK